MKKLLIKAAALILCVAMISGCGPGRPEPPKQPDSPVKKSDGTLKIHMYDRLSGARFTNEAVKLLNDRLNELGFDLELVYEKKFSGDYDADFNPLHLDNYKKFILNNFDGNNLFTMSAWEFFRVLSQELMAEITPYDFYNDAYRLAPSYLSSRFVNKVNDSGTLKVLPLGFTDPSVNALSVLIKNELNDLYGKKIKTGTDYEELLKWLKKHDPDTVPGAAILNSSRVQFQLYFPEMGYWLPRDDVQVACPITENTVVPISSLSETRLAFERLSALFNNGYIETWGMAGGVYKNTVRVEPDLSKYNTFLVNADIFMNLDSSAANYSGVSGFNFADYTMHVLYNEVYPEVGVINELGFMNYHAVAGDNADISEFLRLLQWLDNKDNYRRLYYGVEGVDYVLTDDRVELLDAGKGWAGVRIILSDYFKRKEFEPTPATAPANYREEIESWSPSRRIEFRDEDVKLVMDWEGDTENLKPLNEVWHVYRDIMGGLFVTIILTVKNDRDQIIPDYKLDMNDELTDYYLSEYLPELKKLEPSMEEFYKLYQQAFDRALKK